MKEVIYWSPKEVADWLTKRGLQEYAEAFQSLNGKGLLRLTEDDFRKPPLSRISSDNGCHLLAMLETLKIENHMNGHANGHICKIQEINSNDHSFISKANKNGIQNGIRKEMIKIPMPELERSQSFPDEWKKTLLALFYACICFTLTTVMIAVVHERVPSKAEEAPLPDVFFDYFDRVSWAFSICEINGMVLVVLWLVQWIFFKYKSIVARRFFCIVGTLYLYRCITMYVTTLPVPGMHFNCAPKLFGDTKAQISRIIKMIEGGGLSITGAHTMCGDYLYSGHTVMLTLTYMFIKEYSSRRFWWYHNICFILSLVGIFCILLAHDHYTVDVIVAYYVTSRCFWWYHTMANQKELKESSSSNLLSRVWWFKAFQYFEQNVHGVVPCTYQSPIPLSWIPMRKAKYSKLLNEA